MTIRRLTWLALLLFPLGAGAFFPTSEKATPKEVLEFREKKKAEYQQERLEYEQEVVVSRARVSETMEHVPWRSVVSRSAPVIASKEALQAVRAQEKGQKSLLFLTGLAALALLLVLLYKLVFSRSVTLK